MLSAAHNLSTINYYFQIETLLSCATQYEDLESKKQIEELKETMLQKNLIHKDPLEKYLFTVIERIPQKRYINERDSLLKEEDGFL